MLYAYEVYSCQAKGLLPIATEQPQACWVWVMPSRYQITCALKWRPGEPLYPRHLAVPDGCRCAFVAFLITLGHRFFELGTFIFAGNSVLTWRSFCSRHESNGLVGSITCYFNFFIYVSSVRYCLICESYLGLCSSVQSHYLLCQDGSCLLINLLI